MECYSSIGSETASRWHCVGACTGPSGEVSVSEASLLVAEGKITDKTVRPPAVRPKTHANNELLQPPYPIVTIYIDRIPLARWTLYYGKTIDRYWANGQLLFRFSLCLPEGHAQKRVPPRAMQCLHQHTARTATAAAAAAAAAANHSLKSANSQHHVSGVKAPCHTRIHGISLGIPVTTRV